MRREYPDAPIAGVGAVIVSDGQVLLVQRGHEPLKGEWSLPGGALELGETLQEGICREVLEETGLIVEPLAVVEVFDRIVADADGRTRYHYVLVDFLCRVTGGSLACATDAVDARWVGPEDLFALSPFLAEVIRKGLKMAEASGINR
jgi:ADP-ribose pyrophosphatase YjhB (NUDIX family)